VTKHRNKSFLMVSGSMRDCLLISGQITKLVNISHTVQHPAMLLEGRRSQDEQLPPEQRIIPLCPLHHNNGFVPTIYCVVPKTMTLVFV
jgi:hypothetical protein